MAIGARNFGSILVGPAMFATVYATIGSYALTYAWMSVIAIVGFVPLTLSRGAATRQR